MNYVCHFHSRFHGGREKKSKKHMTRANLKLSSHKAAVCSTIGQDPENKVMKEFNVFFLRLFFFV